MYQPIFDENLNEEELSSLDNFTSLSDLIRAGGIKAERARKIMNQFASNSYSKSTSDLSSGPNSTQTSKKNRYYGAKRFKH